MNYQPFFDMNILVSDQFLQFLDDSRFAIFGFVVANLFLFYIISITFHSIVKLLISKKKRPYITE